MDLKKFIASLSELSNCFIELSSIGLISIWSLIILIYYTYLIFNDKHLYNGKKLIYKVRELFQIFTS